MQQTSHYFITSMMSSKGEVQPLWVRLAASSICDRLPLFDAKWPLIITLDKVAPFYKTT